MPARGASLVEPAAWTTIWKGASTVNGSSAARAASSSVMSKAIASALPPAARISATTASARSRPLWAWTATLAPAAARVRQIAPPMWPLPPLTKACLPSRLMTG